MCSKCITCPRNNFISFSVNNKQIQIIFVNTILSSSHDLFLTICYKLWHWISSSTMLFSRPTFWRFHDINTLNSKYFKYYKFSYQVSSYKLTLIHHAAFFQKFKEKSKYHLKMSIQFWYYFLTTSYKKLSNDKPFSTKNTRRIESMELPYKNNNWNSSAFRHWQNSANINMEKI